MLPCTVRSLSLLASALVVLLLGCREDAEPPTGPEPVPALATATGALSFRQLSAGANHTCAVSSDYRAYCWGYNFYGQLGSGSNTGPEFCPSPSGAFPCSTGPVPVTGGFHFFQVSAGQSFSCGLTTDSLAYCWGSNQKGELGDGSGTDHLAPTAVAGGRRFRQLRAGLDQACAIDLNAVAWCWGANFSGQIGDGSNTVRPTPVRVSGGLHWRQLSGGNSFTCGVTTDNHAYCWGNNGNGQIGDSTKVSRLKPSPVKGGILFRQIDAGWSHTCAVSTTNLAYCWGLGGFGQIGNGGKSQARIWPAAVGGMRSFDHVNAGGNHSCGVTMSGVGYCWGLNQDGQLGIGTNIGPETCFGQSCSTRPVRVVGGLSLAQVNAGYQHTCGRTTYGKVWCWGDNTYGQLGDGTRTNRPAPVAVSGAN
jgi:alpha-tubulin suppressor-like RCC1 family protein